jgi:polysaccharide deacetylase family protein (PEP-CTERM system associated)
MLNVISVDVEDYFHPTEVQLHTRMDLSDWASLPSRVESATQRTLDLLAAHDVRGTFFVLGWVAEHYPSLVRKIAEAGHEIGCHSYAHRLVFELTPEQFEADTLRARKVIEDACGVLVRSYRAPSYSITSKSLWALEVLVACGFTHDSSIYPVLHDRYGIPGFTRQASVITTPAGSILEVPIAVAQISKKRVAPVGGGAYLRLLPYRYTAAGIRRINEQDGSPACIYFHPWEIDPDQPRLISSTLARLRTYTGLRSMTNKLNCILSDFHFSSLAAVHPYLG